MLGKQEGIPSSYGAFLYIATNSIYKANYVSHVNSQFPCIAHTMTWHVPEPYSTLGK